MYISEYSNAGFTPQGVVPVGAEPCTDQSPVSFTGTAGVSAAFQNNTRMVRVHVDGIASIAFGTAPSATTNNKRMVAGATEYFFVPQGSAYKVSAITNS